IQRPQFLQRALPSWQNKIAINRISGSRMDARFIYERNMVDRSNLSGKRIALVGVGTIGGFLAKFLAQSGAGAGGGGQLLLVDNQCLEPGNLGRHLLGLPDIGKNKAQAVREELLRVNPDCEIAAFDGNALERNADLMGYDLLVDATGERA